MQSLIIISIIVFITNCANAAVGLVTVPERDTVRMTVYNSVDLTLVQESRSLVLKKGLNRIQYQWAGTLIDTTSLELRPLEKNADIEILDIIYPPNAPATLIWQVDSKTEGPVRFEISYFTSGVSWNADYVLRASPDEGTASLEGWVAVSNRSGEDYPKAEVRLVVGSINLVESIRDLATGQIQERTRPLLKEEGSRRSEGKVMMKKAMGHAYAAGAASDMAMNIEYDRAPEVISARLGDYHIFSVSGVQAVINNATTRFLAIQNSQPMPLEVLYRVTLGNENVNKLYRFINNEEHHLPQGPLPEGTWHLFRVLDPVTQSLSFTATISNRYVPPGQKVELAQGMDPAIAIRQVHRQHTETEHHFDDDGLLDGWITHDSWDVALTNTRSLPISVECLIPGNGDWTVSNLSGERRDQYTWRHQARVEAGQQLQLNNISISTREGARSMNDGGQAMPPKVPPILPLPRIQTVH